MNNVKELRSLESEAGIIATLIRHPEFSFHSEELLPGHFTEKTNSCIYTAITGLVRSGINTIDPYNIIEFLNSSEATRKFAEEVTIDRLNELMDVCDILARHTPEEYKMLVGTVLDFAFRRDAIARLRECEELCFSSDRENIQQQIYNAVDDVMTEYSTANDIPQYRDVVDGCWKEIYSRQRNGYAGIPFKFPTLNEFATLEAGELFIFAAGAKQGKSIMLLNCAVDLLKSDLSVFYIDSELNTRLHTARLLSHLTGIEYKRLTSGCYSESEAVEIDKAITWLKTRKYTHLYMPIFDQQSVYTAVKKVWHTQGVDVLIVDYFKSSGEGDAWSGYAELGRFTDLVKNKICGDMGIAGLAAVQATESGKVADSAKIGRNTSTLALIQEKTAEEIETDGSECGNKKLRILLNRNGPQHTSGEYIDLKFDGNHILYEEAKQHIPQCPY